LISGTSRGLGLRRRAGRDELAAGGQFLAPTGEQPLDLRLGRQAGLF
jgi:hypothetical protein